ncbi:ATP-binding protein [Bradyrhizobium sp. ORS 285]|uniref:sensor histidine kinase n=2 Tax=Bradyrhizobium sp. ORS 285 TaxID=115808 RepID=UPI00031C6E3A|nr:ATP-binding protein [Bradyrhizobium sp. ORS 285]
MRAIRLPLPSTQVVMFVITIVGAVWWLIYTLAWNVGLVQVEREANDRLALVASTFDATVARYRYLPAVLSLADPIRDLYRKPGDSEVVAAANRYLKSLNESARSAELYVLDSTGHGLAASNFDKEPSFVGEEYSFRTYFKDAINEGAGADYAVGTTTGLPGYFLSHRIVDGGSILGVAVVKIDLTTLESSWSRAGEMVAVQDEDGVLFLSSRQDWKYRPLQAISAQQINDLNVKRKFGQPISATPVFLRESLSQGGQIGTARGRDGSQRDRFLLKARPLEQRWTLLLFSSVEDARWEAALIATVCGFGLVASSLVVLVAYQRRQAIKAKLSSHNILEQRVAERTDELRRTLDSLAQSAKLASLGQALAGVAHEINQPLAAMITYLASSRVLLRRNQVDRATANLDMMSTIAERMMALINHLQMFARNEPGVRDIVDLQEVIEHALRLLRYRLTSEDVEIRYSEPVTSVRVLANPIRMEQVVVNLISNALDAMRESRRRVLQVTLSQVGDSAVVTVSDNGVGIAEEHLGMIFDPFFTTKGVGEGLGLGLSISYGIVRECGGEILVSSTPGRGATFKVTVPIALSAPPQLLREL